MDIQASIYHHTPLVTLAVSRPFQKGLPLLVAELYLVSIWTPFMVMSQSPQRCLNQDFSDLRTLSFYPPDGEFAAETWISCTNDAEWREQSAAK